MGPRAGAELQGGLGGPRAPRGQPYLEVGRHLPQLLQPAAEPRLLQVAAGRLQDVKTVRGGRTDTR